ncbi:FadR/GntR family transcriptional regulator [Fibrella aquatilis]|uniref:FadR family transcriptional regulator n=1 Tax=Fibrella aquatilis TaxID=2817059 RepID=A0A939G694_9BACT|nr:FadR/GntR family transcriptional regulator [Fibrella aquatilis]MBO0931978.1 FadR family transcriptional regulator [Fibrella aquatilis]
MEESKTGLVDQPEVELDTRRGGLHEVVLNGIGQAIVVGEYPVGEVLPHETLLGAKYGIGRNLLREVYKVLAAKGLITSVRKAGTIVQPVESWDLFDPQLIRWAVGTPLLNQIVHSLGEARLVIEPEAAYRAAQRATGKDIYQIEEALATMATGDPNADSFFTADLSFHLAVIRASHNPLWFKFGRLLSEAFMQSFRHSHDAADVEHTIAIHANVLECIRLRNADEAREAMKALLGHAEAVLRLRGID